MSSQSIQEKHSWIVEYEKKVSDLEYNRHLFDDTNFKEEVFGDMADKYGPNWERVWKENQKRELVMNYYEYTKDDDRIGTRMFVRNNLLTIDQSKAMRECRMNLEQVLDEKGPLYESFIRDWNEKLGFKAFLSEFEQKEKESAAALKRSIIFEANENIIKVFAKGKEVGNREVLEQKIEENISMLQEVLRAIRENKI